MLIYNETNTKKTYYNIKTDNPYWINTKSVAKHQPLLLLLLISLSEV